MPLATVDDLVQYVAALGGVQVDASPTSPQYERMLTLLDLAEAQVLTYLEHFGVTDEVIDSWSSNRKKTVSAVVVRCAAKQLQASMAPNVDPYLNGGSMPMSILLTPSERDALREALPDGGANKSVSVEVVRADSWLGHSGDDE